MVFSSPIFLFLFLPILLLLYFTVRAELRNLVLTLGSLFFYLWGEGFYVAVLLVSIGLNYVFGLLLARTGGRASGKAILAASVAANLGLIAFFKYANFFVDNLNVGLAALHLRPIALAPVHLPLGISFFTFQALSYVIDVYRRDVVVQRSLLDFTLYKTLFPQLIAGPIVRYRDVAAELSERPVRFDAFADGTRRFILGMAKKMLLANPLAVAADGIFGVPADGIPGVPVDGLTPGLAWLGIVCYALQIYFDFSGYSDMAIGLGRMFGFTFPENFDYPYVARSVTEFWRRWHMSLSSWFRDYLYIPLGGNRCGRFRTYFNLVLVFFLCGLWHGASWNFILWGLLHGAFLVVERMGLSRVLERLWAPLRHAYLLLVVLAAWVFFRASTLGYALGYLAALAGFASGTGVDHYPQLYLTRELLLALAVAPLAAMPCLPALVRLRDRILARAEEAPGLAPPLSATLGLAAAAVQMLLLVACAAQLASGTHNPFIYFRF
jgi:alginate O-acetyltransferase complex protein AlgI